MGEVSVELYNKMTGLRDNKDVELEWKHTGNVVDFNPILQARLGFNAETHNESQ